MLKHAWLCSNDIALVSTGGDRYAFQFFKS